MDITCLVLIFLTFWRTSSAAHTILDSIFELGLANTIEHLSAPSEWSLLRFYSYSNKNLFRLLNSAEA